MRFELANWRLYAYRIIRRIPILRRQAWRFVSFEFEYFDFEDDDE